jgi:hypothetical protein
METQPIDEHNIVMQINRNDIKRASTYYCYFLDFPVTIPFDNIIQLDNTVIDGKIIKHASIEELDEKDIAIIKADYVDNLDENEFQDFMNVVDTYDSIFIKTDDDLSTKVRLMSDFASVVQNSSWERTCIKIADTMCVKRDRKYCWTHSVPGLNISCYGLEDSDEVCKINDIFSDIGVSNYCITWKS